MKGVRRVLRYVVKVGEQQTLPAGKVVLATPDRHMPEMGHLEVWIETTCGESFAETPTVGEQVIAVAGTGMAIPEDAVHLVSVVDGRFVWNLYNLCICEREPIYKAPGNPEDLVRNYRVESNPDCSVHGSAA